jgi:dienelactone hydrolase
MIQLHSHTDPFEKLKQAFDYYQRMPPIVEEKATEFRNEAQVHDIAYPGQGEGQIKAYLVTPRGKRPFAGIIFIHSGPSDRSSFLDEAAALANMGAISLLINAPWAYPEFGKRAAGMTAKDMRTMFVQTAKDIRRGVDLLQSLPDVDGNRIGFVGHSLGALLGGILSGVEKRLRAHVLMAGTGSFTDVALLNMPDLGGEVLEEYRQTMDKIDPVHYVAHAAPSALFFQFGLQDNFYPRQKFLDYYEAGSEPKSIQWYEANHYNLNEKGRSDRIAWLGDQLKLQQV